MRDNVRLLGKLILLSLLLGVNGLFAAQKEGKAARYRGLAHINIQTRDLEKSIRFYTDNLHFTITNRSELGRPEGVTKMALIQQRSCIIELAQPPNPDSVPEKTKGIIGHFALNVKNIKQVVAELKEKGINLDRDIFTLDQLFGGIRGAFISGPSGESIELFEFMNPARKGKKAN